MNHWLRMGGATIPSRDPASLCAFYCEVLGFRPKGDIEQGDRVIVCYATLKEIELEFRLYPASAGSLSLSFYVDDLGREMDKLRGRGLVVQQGYDGTCDIGGFMDYMREASFLDPEGNVIKLRAVEPEWQPHSEQLLQQFEDRFGLNRTLLASMIDLLPPVVFFELAGIALMATTAEECIQMLRFVKTGGSITELRVECHGNRDEVLLRVRQMKQEG